MPKTIRNKYDEAVTFDKLLEAHKKARRGKREKYKSKCKRIITTKRAISKESC